MSRARAQVFLTIAAVLLLAGCGRGGGASGALTPEAAAGYLGAPVAANAAFAPDGVALSGQAAPRAQVRLATPQGQAWTATADRNGAWSLRLPMTAGPQILGLSMTAGGRRIQAEGYVLVGNAQAALLRPGAGALRLDGAGRGVTAVDFDRQGSGVVSGRAAPGATVALRLDGRYAGDARADEAGRFSLPLAELSPATHQLQVVGDGFDSRVTLDAAPPPPLAEGPLRSQFSPAGLRADWLTPGGGVQSTFLPG